MKIIGIDPGLSGAIAVLEDNKVLNLFDIPVMSEGKKNKRQLNSALLVSLLKQNITKNEEIAVVGELLPTIWLLGIMRKLMRQVITNRARQVVTGSNTVFTTNLPGGDPGGVGAKGEVDQFIHRLDVVTRIIRGDV